MRAGRLMPLLAAAVLATTLAACENTVRGFGQDMQKAGKAIEKSTGTGGSTSGTSATTTAPKQ